MKTLLKQYKIIFVLVFAAMLSSPDFSPTLVAQNAAGSLGGEVVVSVEGLAFYNIPIEVVPGTKGVQPHLAVTYNSAGGLGLLGSCWTLAGCSVISRTPRNVYYDGGVGSINYNNNDRYSLDGKRLIKLSSGSYAVTNAVYGTEVEDFTRVKLYGTPNSTSQYFKAVTGDGVIIEYGNTEDSKQSFGNDVLSWKMNKVIDPDGNFMTIHYTGSNGEIVPLRIDYTGNATANLETYASVRFSYITNPRPNKTWVGGKSITNSRLLSSIAVYYDSSKVREYTFEYTHDRSTRLTAVVLKDATGNELTRTSVNWGADAQSASFQTVTGLSSYNMHTGCFDKDNLMDLVVFNYNTSQQITSWIVKKGDGNGGFSETPIYSGIIIGDAIPHNNFFSIDTDDDGIDEICYIQTFSQGDSARFNIIQFCDNTIQNTTIATNATGVFLPGDFLGTGNMQVLSVGKPNGNNKTVTCVGTDVSFLVHKDARLSVTDINGNGKADVQVVKENYIDVYEYDDIDRSFIKIIDSNYLEHISNRDYHGDFNGDGYMDYVYFAHQGFFIKFSKGNDYTPSFSAPFYPHYNNHDQPSNPVFIGDINGDGKDDVIQLVDNYYTNQLLIVTYYTRNCTSEGLICDTLHFQNDGVFSKTDNQYEFAELNGDGKPELFFTGFSFLSPVIICFPESRGHELAAAFTDGYGKTTGVQYGFYSTPRIGLLGSFGHRVQWPLARRILEPDGVGGTTVTIHFYGSAHYDASRRQLLGFGYHETYCNGMNSWQLFQHDTVRHRLALEQNLVYYHEIDPDEIGGYITDPTFWNRNRDLFFHEETMNTPAVRLLNFGRYVPYNSISSVVNRLENTKCTTMVGLMSDGRPQWSSVSVGREDGPNGVAPPRLESDSTGYTYTTVTVPNGSQVKKPGFVKTWHKRNGCSQTPWRKVAYSYYSSGRPRAMTVTDSEDTLGVTTYTYNNFGLPLTETVAPKDLTETTTTWSYDNTGRFVTGETNALGQTRTAVHNNKTGLLSEETDINGLTTSYRYDAFGRLTRIIRPDSTQHIISYAWNTNLNFGDAVWYARETETGTPETKTWYDIHGRAVHTYRAGSGYNDIVYDSLGRVAKSTAVPYANPSELFLNKTWKTTAYDNYGRVTAETGPYTNLSYTYLNVPVTSQYDYFVDIYDSIRETNSTYTYDALGRLSEAEDDGGSITYGYTYQTISGKTRDVMTVNASGNTTTIVSDIRGNRVSIQDPDAGTVSSAYNALNQLTSRTDANNVTTAYAYDELGRVTRCTHYKGLASETVDYIYDNAPGLGVGKLHKIRHDNNDETVYEYDDFGRVSKKKVADENHNHIQRYAYDTLGRLQSLTYPDGFCLDYHYNTLGELASIHNAADDSLVFSVETRNIFRQPEKCRYGNGTGVQYSYNRYGRVTEIRNGIVTEGAGTQNLGHDVTYYIGTQYRQLSYTYDERGFIHTRSDANINQTETYFYDELDRLASYQVNGVSAGRFEYDRTGNITSNSKVGDYSYNGSQPHAVNRITGISACPIPSTSCAVDYGLWNRPTSITENNHGITFDYGADGMRRNTRLYNGNNFQKKYTRISDLHEVEYLGHATRKLDYIYAEGNVVAVHVRNANHDSLYYILTDHLGSWNMVMDQNKTIVQKSHFDPWGNRMDYTRWDRRPFFLFGIINANARLYDPVIGRFFSPDPFVQAPDFTQNYNRYSYCLNNPVMYSDPDGEYIILDSWIVGFVSTLFKTGSLKQSWQEANKRAGNDAKIWGGLFVTDENKSFWGRTWEFFSRLTWQAPQTIVGWFVAESCNTFGFAGGVESVDYKFGATVTRTNNGGWGAVTLGSYITGSNNIRADENNYLFQHEYGHYIQSQATGIFYLTRYGIPSGLNCLGKKEHNKHPVEQDANIRAFKYFNKHIDGFNGWKRDRNPIKGYDWSQPYTNENNQMALKQGILKPAWYDYFLIFTPLWDAYINWLLLENY